jgi:hypothetical protein
MIERIELPGSMWYVLLKLVKVSQEGGGEEFLPEIPPVKADIENGLVNVL